MGDFMKKKTIFAILITTSVLCLSACGNQTNSKNSGETQKKDSKKVYVEESQIPDIFSSPDKFKGNYVKLSGQIFVEPEKDGDMTALQIWHNPENASNNFIVHYQDANANFKSQDYVIVDGMIDGTFKGENMFGAEVTAPLVIAENIEILSYIDAITPTIKEIVPENAIAEQNGVSLKVDKIEFAEKETRFYLTESNSSQDKYTMYVYSIKIVQNGRQIEQDLSASSRYEGDYPELSDTILPNASSSGIIVFPAMDSSASFQIYAEGFSDNYNLEFSPFTIDITAQ